MAMADWSAKIRNSSICPAVNGLTSLRNTPRTPATSPAPEEWDSQHGPVATDLLTLVPAVLRIGEHVGDLHGPPLESDAANEELATWLHRHVLLELHELRRAT
jgi:hypothetical protein